MSPLWATNLRLTFVLILAILRTASSGDDTQAGFPHPTPIADLPPLSQPQYQTGNKGDNGSNPVTFNFNPKIKVDLPSMTETLSQLGKAMAGFIRNLNKTLEKETQNFKKGGDYLPVPSKFLQETFAKGEHEWLTREKTIQNLWMKNEGADPKSTLGTAYAFNAPTTQSLLVSNTSVLLEYASRAFLKGFNDTVFDVTANSAATLRTKRQANSLSDLEGANPLRRVDITPFVPAHEYIARCGFNEESCPCDASKLYRSYSGWCNNLRQPSMGKSVTVFDRMLPPVYDDGISIPKRRSVTGRLLPSPRHISSRVHIDVSNLSQRNTLMFMQYAQFLDHDITFTPVNKGPRNSILNCRECDSTQTVHPECWPIPVPATDSYYPAQAAAASGKGYCIPFTRSLAGQQQLGPREQINQNSAYMDSSQIYGENYCKAMSLRTTGGMLNATFNPTRGFKVLMPQVTHMKECRSPSGYCFYAGDTRASEQPALAAVHTIYLREHNRITEELHRINPHWDDETLYQQARRILSAMNQHVAYSEFLPRLIGTTLVNAYGLGLQNEGYYAGYDPSCEVSVYNEFAAAAFRFGHSLVRPNFARMDNRYNGMNSYLPLRDVFFNSDMLYKSLMVDEIIRGLIAEPMEQMDPFVTKEITNHLFESKKKSFSGLDLIALNLHRGRDHGLQGYNAYRDVCGLSRANKFQDLQTEIPTDVIMRLQEVYDHVDDIDLFTGSMVERPVSGGIVGPTMSCIIANQFKRIRQCDRFWYETNDPLLKFSPVQLAEIRKATLSKIICANFDMPSEIQKIAFDGPHSVLNPRLPCDRLPTVRLEVWRETPSVQPPSHHGCQIGNRRVGLGEVAPQSPCVSCLCTTEGAKCNSIRISNCARLLLESNREDIMQDTVCTSQCAQWLGLGTSTNQHNDVNLQTLQPPPPPSNRFNIQSANTLFHIINGKRTG